MARAFDDGSSQYLRNANDVVSAVPFSFAAWYNTDVDTLPIAVLAMDGGGTTDFAELFLWGNGGDEISFWVRGQDDGSYLQANTTSAFSINTWQHAAGVCSGLSSASAYLNGGSKGTSTVTTLAPTYDQTTVGGRFDTINHAFSGSIAEAGIWDVALTDAEVATLALGYSPLLVRPASLVAYWPLIGRMSPEIDLVGGFDMTLNGSPTTADHPPTIYYPVPDLMYISGPTIAKTYYVGPGGDDANDGLSWANRKLTLNGAEDIPVVAGDTVYVAPGTYRELLTVDVAGTSGNLIAFMGDVTGIKTDGIGGEVRVTGSDNDTSVTRASAISVAAARDYRKFTGFKFDSFTGDVITATSSVSNWVIEDCQFIWEQAASGSGIELTNVGASGYDNISIRRCVFNSGNDGTRELMRIVDTTTARDDTNILIEDCLFIGAGDGLYIERIGGIAVRNCSFMNVTNRAIAVDGALSVGQTTDVNNCLFFSCSTGVWANTGMEDDITENFNNFFACGTDRSGPSAGGSSVSQVPMLDTPVLYARHNLNLMHNDWRMFGPTGVSGWGAKVGTNKSTKDIFGTVKPETDVKSSWGAIQVVNAVARNTVTTRSGSTASLAMDDASQQRFKVLVSPVPTTFSVYANREANYAGYPPQMVIKQPGEGPVYADDEGSAGAFNQLTKTITPSITSNYVFIELVSNNTATSGSYKVYWEDLTATT